LGLFFLKVTFDGGRLFCSSSSALFLPPLSSWSRRLLQNGDPLAPPFLLSPLFFHFVTLGDPCVQNSRDCSFDSCGLPAERWQPSKLSVDPFFFCVPLTPFLACFSQRWFGVSQTVLFAFWLPFQHTFSQSVPSFSFGPIPGQTFLRLFPSVTRMLVKS